MKIEAVESLLLGGAHFVRITTDSGLVGLGHVEGSITNLEDVRRALDGVDSFINLVMRSPRGCPTT